MAGPVESDSESDAGPLRRLLVGDSSLYCQRNTRRKSGREQTIYMDKVFAQRGQLLKCHKHNGGGVREFLNGLVADKGSTYDQIGISYFGNEHTKKKIDPDVWYPVWYKLFDHLQWRKYKSHTRVIFWMGGFGLKYGYTNPVYDENMAVIRKWIRDAGFRVITQFKFMAELHMGNAEHVLWEEQDTLADFWEGMYSGQFSDSGEDEPLPTAARCFDPISKLSPWRQKLGGTPKASPVNAADAAKVVYGSPRTATTPPAPRSPTSVGSPTPSQAASQSPQSAPIRPAPAFDVFAQGIPAWFYEDSVPAMNNAQQFPDLKTSCQQKVVRRHQSPWCGAVSGHSASAWLNVSGSPSAVTGAGSGGSSAASERSVPWWAQPAQPSSPEAQPAQPSSPEAQPAQPSSPEVPTLAEAKLAEPAKLAQAAPAVEEVAAMEAEEKSFAPRGRWNGKGASEAPPPAPEQHRWTRAKDATEAIAKWNHWKAEKPRWMWLPEGFEVEQCWHKSNDGTYVYVNVPRNCDEAYAQQIFQAWGPVAKIYLHPRRWGYVRFYNRASAADLLKFKEIVRG